MTSDVAADRQVLAGSRAWRATPDNYSSLRFFQFAADGSGELTYAYGQTIYAVAQCRWELPVAGQLRLTYSGVPRGVLARTFALSDGNRVKELAYTLTAGRVAGVEDIVPNPYEFSWTLALSDSPWPAGLDLPHEVPRVFYGQEAADEEPVA